MVGVKFTSFRIPPVTKGDMSYRTSWEMSSSDRICTGKPTRGGESGSRRRPFSSPRRHLFAVGFDSKDQDRMEERPETLGFRNEKTIERPRKDVKTGTKDREPSS